MFGFFKKGKTSQSQPWLQNKAWAEGRIPAAGDAANASALLVIGLVCAGVCVGAFLFQNYDGFAGIKWGLPVVMFIFAVCFTAGAFYTRALRRKFGRTYFKLDSNPGIIGGFLSGVIQVEKPLQESTTFLIKLQSLEMIPQSSNDDSQQQRAKIIWEDRLAVSVPKAQVGKLQCVPVKFHIPGNSLETDGPSTRRKVFWQLQAHAKLHGLDFNATFEVPIFRVRTEVKTATS